MLNTSTVSSIINEYSNQYPSWEGEDDNVKTIRIVQYVQTYQWVQKRMGYTVKNENIKKIIFKIFSER
jgi:hypothetical protein